MRFAEFATGALAALDQFGQNQLGPALGDAGRALNHFGQHQLGPAVARMAGAVAPVAGEVGKTLDEFGRETLGPALGGAGKAIDDFGMNTFGVEIGKTLDEFGKNTVGPAVGGVGKVLDDFGKNTLRPAVEEAGQKIGPAIEDAKNWVEEHPGEAALIGTSVLTMAFPGIIYGPILSVFGWGSTGVRAGSAAAAIQAAAGQITAGSTFATVQSAAMGGYGSMVLGAFIRVGSAILGVAGVVNAVEDANKESEEGDGGKEGKEE